MGLVFDDEKQILMQVKEATRSEENKDNPLWQDLNRVIELCTKIIKESETLVSFSDCLQQSLKETNDKLVIANEFKNQLMSLAIHDLGDPLTVVVSYSEILKARLNPGPRHTKMLTAIHRAAKRMQTLRGELLGNERFDIKSIKIKNTSFSLSDLVHDVIADHQMLAEKKKQKFIYTPLPAPDCRVVSDTFIVKEIISNIISNAVKYSPLGKEIVVSMEKKQDEEGQDSLVLGVHDQGTGFTEHDKTLLFKKIRKLSSKPTAGESSTGIGLFLAKKFTDLLKGKLWVESEKNKGSSVYFELEAAR